MKAAVLSDIHGNGTALKHALKNLRSLGISKIIILGDVVVKGPTPSQVLELLMDSNLEIIAWIKGNTDLWFEEISENWIPSTDLEKKLYLYYQYAKNNLSEEQLLFIKKLPFHCSVTLNRYKILCVHGSPRSIVEAIDDSTPKEEIKKALEGVTEEVILSGHSHTPFLGEIDGKKLFNVGSVGNSLDGDNRISYGILDFEDKKIKLINKRISYPTGKIIDAAVKNNFPFTDEYKSMIINATIR